MSLYSIFEDYFPVVEFHYRDRRFLDYFTLNPEYIQFKRRMNSYLKSGSCRIRFRAQIMAPTLGKDGELHYGIDTKPILITQKQYGSYKKKARNVCPELSSRIGTLEEYDIYCAAMIQKLIHQHHCSHKEAYDLVLRKPSLIIDRRNGFQMIRKNIWSDHNLRFHFVQSSDRNHNPLLVLGSSRRSLCQRGKKYSRGTVFIVMDR